MGHLRKTQAQRVFSASLNLNVPDHRRDSLFHGGGQSGAGPCGNLGNAILSVHRGAGSGPRHVSAGGLGGRKHPQGIDAAA